MKNKKGYILVYALGVITLLMILVATLSNITLTRSKWSDDQVKTVIESAYAKSQVEAASNEITTYFEKLNNKKENYLSDIIDDIYHNFFKIIENKYKVTITPLYSLDENQYSYEFLISYSGDKVIAQRKLFLSVMPSFLFFALGSNTDVNINGGAYVNGDIYVNRHLYLADTTNYILDTTLYHDVPTSLFTINPEYSIYFQSSHHDILSCYDTGNCFIIENDTFIKNQFISNPLDVLYEVSERPITMQYYNRFLEVDFDESFLYYIKNDIIQKENLNLYPDIDRDEPIKDKLSHLLPQLVSDDLIIQVTDYNEINDSIKKPVLIANDVRVETDLSFRDHWIIVDGDLLFNNYDNNQAINIDANFLVTGNVTISGNININSTIYALGEGLVHNASINTENTNSTQLVLLTKDKLKFSKINEFVNTFDGIQLTDDGLTFKPTIKGFFYTNSSMEIYTINSYLVIEGGIFSNDNSNRELDINGEIIIKENEYITKTDSIGLLINSFRGRVYNDTSSPKLTFIFEKDDNFLQSRFVINYSTDILKAQKKGLPINKQFNYFFEKTIISTKR
ncbi:MAG TPA: hypothetical protein VIK84_06365 [Haloplasmataceae bacterium]